MKKFILIFLSLIYLSLANEIIEMQPYNPTENFDILRPFEKKVPELKLDEGFSTPVQNINDVNTIIQDDTGYYLSGNSLTTDNINLNFDSKSFTDSINNSSMYSSNINNKTFSISSKNIFVSLLHYSKEGTFLWRNDFANDMLSSTAMIRLKDGSLILALTPVYIDKDQPFSSYIFSYSKKGKLLSKRKYKDYIINSLFPISDNKILCGVNKFVGGKFQITALLIDGDGFKIKDIDLNSQSSFNTIYEDITQITKISSGYLLSGGQELFKLDEDLKLSKGFYLGPRLDEYSSYYVNAVHEDTKGNISLVGNYGHEQNPIQAMKLDRLHSLNNPRNLNEHLDPASRAIRKNTAVSMAYDEMIREQRRYNQKRTHGYTGVYTKDDSFLTLIKEGDYGQHLNFHGTSEKDGLFYFEHGGTIETRKKYLFDKTAKLIMRSEQGSSFCKIKCMMKDNDLLYISREQETNILKFNKIGFKLQ